MLTFGMHNDRKDDSKLQTAPDTERTGGKHFIWDHCMVLYQPLNS